MAKGHLQCVEFLKNAQVMTSAHVSPPDGGAAVSPAAAAATQTHSQHDIPAVTLEDEQLQLIDTLVDRKSRQDAKKSEQAAPHADEKPSQTTLADLAGATPAKKEPVDSVQSRLAEETGEVKAQAAGKDATPRGRSSSKPVGPVASTAATGASGKSQSQGNHMTLPSRRPRGKKNVSTDNDDSSERSWVWTSEDDENEDQGWIFDGSGERRPVRTKSHDATHSLSVEKKKKKKKTLSDRQKEKGGDGAKERKLNGIGKMLKTASIAGFQLSPRSRRNEDLLERFSMLTAKEREDLSKSHSSDSLDSIKDVAGDFITRGGVNDRSENDLTENDGENEATLTSYLTDSDDSDDEFGEKEIDYSKLDKYGFLKDDGYVHSALHSNLQWPYLLLMLAGGRRSHQGDLRIIDEEKSGGGFESAQVEQNHSTLGHLQAKEEGERLSYTDFCVLACAAR
jgi:hypothetical protein